MELSRAQVWLKNQLSPIKINNNLIKVSKKVPRMKLKEHNYRICHISIIATKEQ